MNRSIDEIMYITDGHNPMRTGLIYGYGGLGYKPSIFTISGSGYLENIDRQIKELEPIVKRTGKFKKELSELFRIKNGTIKRMKGGMIGGMAKPDVYENEFTTEIYDDDKAELKNISMNDFVENYLEQIPEEQRNQRLFNELNDIKFQLENGLYTIIDDNDEIRLKKAITPILNYLFLNQDNLSNEEMIEYNNLSSEFKKYGIEIDGNKFNDEIVIENGIPKNQNKGEIYSYLDKISINEKEKNENLKDKTKDYIRGDLSELINSDLDIITDVLEGKKGNVYTSKEENFYNEKFLDYLKNIHISIGDIKKKLFDKFIIDAIRFNNDGTSTLLELKSQKDNIYNETKFTDGSYNFENGIRCDCRIIYNVENKNTGLTKKKIFSDIDVKNEKIKGIDNIYANIYEYGEKKNDKPIKVVGSSDNNMNYLLLDFSNKGIKYANVLQNMDIIKTDILNENFNIKEKRKENEKEGKQNEYETKHNKVRLNEKIFKYLPQSYEKQLKQTIEDYTTSKDPRVNKKKGYNKYNYIKNKLLL